jgi:uncharacterized protein YdgA (DUF945 family)
MKKIIITCLSALLLMGAFSNNSFSQQKAKAEKKENKDKDDDDWNFNGSQSPGTWDAVIKDDQVNIQFFGAHWSSGRNFPLSELGALPNGKIGEFSLNREAGKMALKGVFENQFGHGTYRFDENEQFKAYLAQRGYKNLDNQLMLDVFFTDINRLILII